VRANLLGLLIGLCLFGPAIVIYRKLVYSDEQPPWLRAVVVVGGEFLGLMCFVAARAAVVRIGWAPEPQQAPLQVLAPALGAMIGAAIVLAWREYHRNPAPKRPAWDPID